MKVYLVNESIEGSDAVVKVFAKREDADNFAKMLLAEILEDVDPDCIEFGIDVDAYVVEMDVE